MRNKIVLLFGSFNPVTKAHVETLTKSMESVGADKGIFIPTSFEHIYSKMIKSQGRMALSNELRIKMLQSVCDSDNRLSVCTYEIDNSIVSNTKETLEYLIKNNPDSVIYYTCGADKLKSFSKWKNIEDILNNVEVLVFERSDIVIDSFLDNNPLLNKFKDKFHVMNNISDSLVSSTKVRELFFNGNLEYKNILPRGVGEIFSNLKIDDYPPLDFNEWIKLMHKYGGMHGSEIALKKLYLENKKIMKDLTVSDTVFYSSPELNINLTNYHGEVSCVNSDLIMEYEKLLRDNYHPVIINVCNKERSCGKYDMGDFKTISDEEELCRISNLSNYLYPYGKVSFKAVKECDVPYKGEKYPLNNNDIIYCKEVVVFRNNKNDWYTLLTDVVSSDIILFSALSLREKETVLLREDLKYRNSDGSLNRDGKNELKNRFINALHVALINNKDSIVLGDLGIRNYYLLESDVLEVVDEVLNEYKNKFKKIVIVLPYKRSNSYKQFYERFNGE